jgi:hypothetical protein
MLKVCGARAGQATGGRRRAIDVAKAGKEFSWRHARGPKVIWKQYEVRLQVEGA